MPVLVGIRREASVRVPGSDKLIPFVDFRAHLDPTTRGVVVDKNWLRRPNERSHVLTIEVQNERTSGGYYIKGGVPITSNK